MASRRDFIQLKIGNVKTEFFNYVIYITIKDSLFNAVYSMLKFKVIKTNEKTDKKKRHYNETYTKGTFFLVETEWPKVARFFVTIFQPFFNFLNYAYKYRCTRI